MSISSKCLSLKIVAFALLGLVFSGHAVLAGEVNEPYEKIDLSLYIKENRPHQKGSKSIVPPKNVSFFGKIMQLPEAGEFEYVYLALELMKVTPMPEVTHQMYIAAEDGKVVSMYVEKNAAAVFNQYAKTGETLHFKGYHIYNYKRGPAIVIEGLIGEPLISADAS